MRELRFVRFASVFFLGGFCGALTPVLDGAAWWCVYAAGALLASVLNATLVSREEAQQ